MQKISAFMGVLVALLMVLPASAQQRIGFVGGLNIANFNGVGEDGEDIPFSSRNGFGVGGVLELGLNENITLRLEPMYLQKGGTFEGFLQDFQFDAFPQDFLAEFKFKAAYLEVPVLFKLALQTSTIQLYVMAGPTLGLLLNSKLEINSSAAALADEINFDGLSKFHRFRPGLRCWYELPDR